VASRSKPAVDAASVSLSGVDLFLAARTSRRVRLPASLRHGRHRANGARPALAGPVEMAEDLPEIHLVDGDGAAETSRIALRRRFEDISDGGRPLGIFPQESVAG
jgi:hypothetical protein